MDNTADILRDFETQSDLDRKRETDASGKENYGRRLGRLILSLLLVSG